jgi:transcriptional regulator with XRE-family HTH domain
MAVRKNRDQIRQSAATAIKKSREQSGISQIALARTLGVSQPLVSAWERAKVAPSLEDLVAIESALSLNRGSLILDVAYGGATSE